MMFRSVCVLLAVQFFQVDSCLISLKGEDLSDNSGIDYRFQDNAGCQPPACTTLDLTSCQLQDLDFSWSGFENLENLILHDNNIKELPAGIFDELPGLTKLDLSKNAIEVLPDNIFDKLTELKLLHLHINEIKEFPVGIFDKLTKLTKLLAYLNKIVTIAPNVFDMLTQLTHIFLNQNEIAVLPDNIFDSQTLMTHLYLYQNPIKEFPDGIFDEMPELTKLNLANMHLTKLSDGVFDKLTKLTTLQIFNNRLTELPDGIFDEVTELDNLGISGNKFNEFGLRANVFDELSKLQYFDIYKSGAACSTANPNAGPGECYENSQGHTYILHNGATPSPTCDLRLDSDDIEKTWMNAYTISKGEVTVKVQEELEWTVIADVTGDAKLTLSGNTATCSFNWSYKEALCDYREWTGMIGIYELLQCSTPVTKDLAVDGDAAKISQVRVEFQMVSSRDVKYYIAGRETANSTTKRTTLLPMLFNFQTTIDVQSADITVTSMFFPVTNYVVTLTDSGGGLTDVKKDEISKTIATFFNFPTAALKFTFDETSGIVVTAQVPGDVSGSCSLLTFTPNFDVSVAAVCTVGQDFASIREVTERSVVSVKMTDKLFAEAQVKVYTNLQVPFEVINPIHIGTKPFTFSNFSTTGTCGVDTACVKYFEWTMQDNNSSSPVCDFSDNYEVQFDVVCSQANIDLANFKCPLDGNEKISASLSLESGNHCPDAGEAVAIALLATDLVSNRVDSGAEVPIDSFLNTQKLKFHSDVRSEDAALKDASFIAISIKAVNGGANAVDLTLLDDTGVTVDGRLLTLELISVVNSNTVPANVASVLSPSFTLIADAGALGLAVQETAVFKVTATIAAVYKAGRRRALLQVSYDASTETSRTVIISAEDPALEVFEESAAHGSVPAGILLALLSVYIVLALHF